MIINVANAQYFLMKFLLVAMIANIGHGWRIANLTFRILSAMPT